MTPRTVVDGLLNIVSGLGTRRDKNAQSFYAKTDMLRNWEELEAFYNENWVAQKIVLTVALDMTRQWRKVTAQSLSPAKLEEFTEAETTLCLRAKVQEAIMWARLYGGCALIPLIKNQRDLSMPLNLDSVKVGDLTGFNVVEARSIYPSTLVELDPFSPNFLLPQYYTVINATQKIHHTRIIRLIGKPLPRFERQRNLYWGLSAIQAVRRTLIQAETGVGACAALLHEMNLDVISIQGLANKLAAGGEKQIMERFELYHTLKSIWNVTIVDSEEQVNSRQLSLSGMDRLLEQFYKIVSGACDIPYTRLMGQSAAGFNATGESDMRNYYDMLKNEQEMQVRPGLTLIDELICRSLWGAPVADLKFEWCPLWQETNGERATREKTEAERDVAYLTSLVLTPSIVAQELQQRGTYDNISDEYVAFLKDAEELEHEASTDSGEDETAASGGGEEDASAGAA